MNESGYSKILIQQKIKAGFIGQRMFVIPKHVISSIKNNPLISSLYLTDVGYFPHAKNHFRERKSGCEQYILVYCIEGHGLVNIFNKEIQLSPNTYFIIPRIISHKYQAVKNDPWTIYWVHFTGSHSSLLYGKVLKDNEKRATYIPFDERRISLFNNIMDILELGYSSDNLDFVNISLWQLLCSFIYDNYFLKFTQKQSNLDIVNSAISYVKENPDEPILIKDIADRFNYSSSHFLTLFKKKTGYTPSHYFNLMKIQQACQYLSFTTMSIKEICFGLGYNDPLYFSRLFKKIMGIPPNSYRDKFNG